MHDYPFFFTGLVNFCNGKAKKIDLESWWQLKNLVENDNYLPLSPPNNFLSAIKIFNPFLPTFLLSPLLTLKKSIIMTHNCLTTFRLFPPLQNKKEKHISFFFSCLCNKISDFNCWKMSLLFSGNKKWTNKKFFIIHGSTSVKQNKTNFAIIERGKLMKDQGKKVRKKKEGGSQKERLTMDEKRKAPGKVSILFQ